MLSELESLISSGRLFNHEETLLSEQIKGISKPIMYTSVSYGILFIYLFFF